MDERQPLPLLRLLPDVVRSAARRRGESFSEARITMSNSREPDPFLEPERYELSETPHYHFDLNRRDFLAVTGAGLLILATHTDAIAQTGREKETLSARLHIANDGRNPV